MNSAQAPKFSLVSHWAPTDFVLGVHIRTNLGGTLLFADCRFDMACVLLEYLSVTMFSRLLYHTVLAMLIVAGSGLGLDTLTVCQATLSVCQAPERIGWFSCKESHLVDSCCPLDAPAESNQASSENIPCCLTMDVAPDKWVAGDQLTFSRIPGYTLLPDSIRDAATGPGCRRASLSCPLRRNPLCTCSSAASSRRPFIALCTVSGIPSSVSRVFERSL